MPKPRPDPAIPSLLRDIAAARASSDSSEDAGWGTLGEPAANAGRARLAHLVETPAAALRHGFYEADCFVPLHRHDCDVLVYGVGGPCVEFAGSGQIIKRRLTYHPRGYEHALRFQGPTHVLAIEIPKSADAWAAVSTPLLATHYNHVWLALLAIADRQPIETITHALEDLLAAARAYVTGSRPEWLMPVVDAIHGDWRGVQSVKALADLFGVSRQHLCRAFKQHLGVTIGQYSLALRIDHARGLLWSTDMPISEIAAETGFSDQAHLTRVLGEHSNRTPARLRWKAPCLQMREPIAAIG